MPGNYNKLVTVISGQTITASERNNEFDNVINNMTPDGVDDASADIAAMRATTDPAGGSLATDLRGELKRLRFQLLKLGAASGNWYDALPFLAALAPASPGATATDLNNRLAQIVNQIKDLSGATNWYDALTAALLKSGGTLTGNLVFNPTTKGVKGTTTNDNAEAGNCGEYVEATATASAYPGNAQFKDAASISLTAGDWDVLGMYNFDANAATYTQVQLNITTTSGNSGAGVTSYNTAVYLQTSAAATPRYISLVLPAYRISIASTTTYYLKQYAEYTGGAPTTLGARISARRVR